MTASTVGPSATRRGSSVRYPNEQLRATAVLDGSAGSAAATATASPSSHILRNPSAWICPILPQPTSPIRNGRCASLTEPQPLAGRLRSVRCARCSLGAWGARRAPSARGGVQRAASPSSARRHTRGYCGPEPGRGEKLVERVGGGGGEGGEAGHGLG